MTDRFRTHFEKSVRFRFPARTRGYLTRMAQGTQAKVAAERRRPSRALRPLLVLGGVATLWWILLSGPAQAAGPAGDRSSTTGVLPETGASATMLLFLLLGLAAVFGGIYLVRHDRRPPPRRKEVSRSSDHR